MRHFTQINRDGKVVVTLSMWGDDPSQEDIKQILEDAANALLTEDDELE